MQKKILVYKQNLFIVNSKSATCPLRYFESNEVLTESILGCDTWSSTGEPEAGLDLISGAQTE